MKLKERGACTMCEVLDRIEQRGLIQGRKEGIEEGIQEGIQQMIFKRLMKW